MGPSGEPDEIEIHPDPLHRLYAPSGRYLCNVARRWRSRLPEHARCARQAPARALPASSNDAGLSPLHWLVVISAPDEAPATREAGLSTPNLLSTSTTPAEACHAEWGDCAGHTGDTSRYAAHQKMRTDVIENKESRSAERHAHRRCQTGGSQCQVGSHHAGLRSQCSGLT